MYIRSSECLPDIERLIRQQNATAQPRAIEMSADEVKDLALRLVLKYSQNYVKETSKVTESFIFKPGLLLNIIFTPCLMINIIITIGLLIRINT